MKKVQPSVTLDLMPKIVDHEEYRRELLTKSFDAMAEKGYSALTMRDLSKAIGVSTGTIYHYFESKQAIFEALLDYFLNSKATNFLEFAAQSKNFEQGLDLLLDWMQENEEYFMKWTLIQIDVYRSGDEVLLTKMRDTFCSPALLEIFKQRLFIDDENICDFIGVFMSGMVMERALSGRDLRWSQQRTLLKTMLQLYFKKHK